MCCNKQAPEIVAQKCEEASERRGETIQKLSNVQKTAEISHTYDSSHIMVRHYMKTLLPTMTYHYEGGTFLIISCQTRQ